MTVDDVATIIRQGTGRMPAFPELGGRNITDIAEFVVTGKDKGKRSGAREGSQLAEVPQRRLRHLSRS